MPVVDHNIASGTAHQRNTSVGAEFSLIKISLHQEGESSATIAITQRLGSPLLIRPSHQPLSTLLQSSENTEIRPKYFNGRNVYMSRTATFVDSNGSMVQTFVDAYTGDHLHMASDWLGTMIICLSTFLSRIDLADILTRSLLIYAHGCVEPHLRGDFGILLNVVSKHAGTILSLDSMFDKLESTRNIIRKNVETKCPGLAWHQMFTPPRTRSEREDFVELVYQLLSASSEGAKIYVRSVKLFALASLLAHYGWQIDIMAQEEHGESPVLIHYQRRIGVMTVVYSLDESIVDDFVEDHARRGRHMTFDMPGAHFYPTILSKAGKWRNSNALYISTGQHEEESFLKGYEKVKNAWDHSGRLLTTTLRQGELIAWMDLDSWIFQVERAGTKHDHFGLINKFALSRLKRIPIVEAVLDLVSDIHVDPDFEIGATYEWQERRSADAAGSTRRLSFAALLQLLLDAMSAAQDLTRKSIAGGILAILDAAIQALVRIPEECCIRVPVGGSIETLVQHASEHLKRLFDPQHGLRLCDAVILCAARLAGVNLEYLRISKTTAREAIIGFWNGQQGILLTPVSERSLLCDLPEGHRLPLTLHNTPMNGIPTDGDGWIKAGTPTPPYDRQLARFPSVRPGHSKITLQYRAHFEDDLSELVAAVYINGVFFNLLSVSQALAHYDAYMTHGLGSTCKHSLPQRSAPPPQMKYLSMRSLDTGVRIVPDETCNGSVIISPHRSRTSRLFAYLLYIDKRPVVQDGCFKCAITQAGGNGRIIISKLESDSASHPV